MTAGPRARPAIERPSTLWYPSMLRMASFRPSPASTLVAFACAFGALAGCTAGSGSPDAGSPGSGDLPCSTEAECADQHLVCDHLRRTCVCTKDAMCAGNPAGAYCNAFTGRCVKDIAGCKSDRECGEGNFCDAALRTCRAKKAWCEPCTQDEECGGPDDFCIHHPEFQTTPTFCGVACGAGDACPAGQKCATTEKGKQCLPEVGRCNQAASCTPDSGQPCGVDTDCTLGDGQLCDQVLGRCVAGQSSCAQGQACDPVTHQCVAGCRLDRECVERFSDPMYSCLNNSCVRAETCHGDGDCPSTKWCFKASGAGDAAAGTCQAACNADLDCPLGQRCVNNPTTARRRCLDGCVNGDNSGCSLNAICNNGGCEYAGPNGVRRCQVKEVCAFRESCLNSSCVPAPDHCKACSAGCGAGACATIYSNVTCGGSAQCPAGIAQACGNVDGCASSGGYACACPMQRCLYRCTTDVQCPKGFTCQGAAVNGNNGPWCYPVDATLCK